MSFELVFTPQILVTALSIFFIRFVSLSLDTIRIISVIRGKKSLAWISGFLTVILFVVALSLVLSNMDNFINLIGFAAGFSTGTVAGIKVEERMAIGFKQLNIVSPLLGAGMAEALREHGFAATEISARGMDGSVTLIKCDVPRKMIGSLEEIVYDTDPSAFVTIQDVLPVHRGFWGRSSGR